MQPHPVTNTGAKTGRLDKVVGGKEWRVLGMLLCAMPRLSARTAKDAHRTGLAEAPKQGRRGTDGWLFLQEMVDCGKAASGRCRKCANGPGHGPYWYRYRWYDGKMHKRYVGKSLPESELGPSAKGTDVALQSARRSSGRQ
jgi:hypothetical protein